MAAESPVVIHEHQFIKLKSVLARICVECAARVVLLVDRDGQPIASHGDIAGLDTTSFSSLAAGNVAATTSRFGISDITVTGAIADA